MDDPPRTLQKDIIQAHHDDPTAGHLGFAKIYFGVRSNYFWRSMYRTINYIRTCHQCQLHKTRNTQSSGLLHSITPPQRPFQTIEIDFFGQFHFSANNNRWIIVTVDYLTGYAETACVPAATLEEVATFFLNNILSRHGEHQVIIGDIGTPFTAKLLDELLRLANTVHKLASAYHSQTNGLTERLNRSLSDMMSMHIAESHTNLDDIVPYETFGYSTARHTTTSFSPYYLTP